MYYMTTWFGKGASTVSGAWTLYETEEHANRAIQYIVGTLKSKWYKGQMEKGANTGRLHIQLMVETRYTLEELIEIGKYREWDWHVEPIEDMEESALYVGKKDTRVSRTYRSYEEEECDFEKNYKERNWERTLAGELSPGVVCTIYDPEGGLGKTTRAKYLVAREEAVYIPALGYKDIMRYGFNWPGNHYIVNIERMHDVNRKELWAGIELLADGVSYDDRYESKMRLQDKPMVEVHMNEMTKVPMLSSYKLKEFRAKGGEILRMHR